jgi:hypothetical protein
MPVCRFKGGGQTVKVPFGLGQHGEVLKGQEDRVGLWLVLPGWHHMRV